MKIISADNNSYIDIELFKDEDSGYSSFEVEAFVDIGHGEFKAKNTDLHFLDFEDFTNDFDNFIIDRNITCRLNGTYSSYIKIYGEYNTVFIQFCIGDAFCGNKTYDYKFSGEFTIDQGDLLDYLNSFKEFAANDRN